ncbi:MAG: hypothetical protein Q9216_007208, partial [Gyalolechia sp. 2 TL-2023]
IQDPPPPDPHAAAIQMQHVAHEHAPQHPLPYLHRRRAPQHVGLDPREEQQVPAQLRVDGERVGVVFCGGGEAGEVGAREEEGDGAAEEGGEGFEVEE